MMTEELEVKEIRLLIESLKTFEDITYVTAVLKRLRYYVRDGRTEKLGLWEEIVAALSEKLLTTKSPETFWAILSLVCNEYLLTSELGTRGASIATMAVQALSRTDLTLPPPPVSMQFNATAVCDVLGMAIELVPGALQMLLNIAKDEAYGAGMRESAAEAIAGPRDLED